jgi:hypothetical protein
MERQIVGVQKVCKISFVFTVRYSSLYFVMAIDRDEDNELLSLEFIHTFCVLLDTYFGKCDELDLVFGFESV